MDTFLKLLSAVVATVIIGVVVVELDVLPPPMRSRARASLHSTVDDLTRLPGVSRILREFH